MGINPADLVDPVELTPEEASVLEDEIPPEVVEANKGILTAETIAGMRIGRPNKSTFLNILVYGDPGVGKTRFAGSASLVEELCPVLVLDFEGGTLSLAEDYPDVHVWPDREEGEVPDWKAMVEMYTWLYDKNPYRTIVIDSLTEIQKFCMKVVMAEMKAKPENANRDPEVGSFKEWNKQLERLRSLVRGLRDLPQTTTIWTALRHDDKDKEGNLIKTYPALPGQLKGEVAGYVDEVFYMYQKEFAEGPEKTMKTFALTQATERQVAKDRSGKLPPVMEAPTMVEVFELITGKRAA